MSVDLLAHFIQLFSFLKMPAINLGSFTPANSKFLSAEIPAIIIFNRDSNAEYTEHRGQFICPRGLD